MISADTNTLLKLESVNWRKMLRTTGSIWEKLRGSLRSFVAEGVSAAVVYQIRRGRLRSELGEGVAGGGRSKAPHGGAMDGLAGVLGFLATVHQKTKEKHQRDEELTADLPRALAQAERGQGVGVTRGGGKFLGEIELEAARAPDAK